MRSKVVAIMLALVTMVTALPMNAMAAEERREQVRNDGEGFFVQAAMSVTAEDLEDMNLKAMVSFPVTMPLTRSGNVYSGSGDIYMFGILGEGKKLTVAINESDTANRGVIKYRKVVDGTPTYTVVDTKYFQSCVSTVTGDAVDGFTNQNGIDNLVAKNNSQTIPHTVQINFTVTGLIPVMGVGDYVTSTPLTVHIVDDNG